MAVSNHQVPLLRRNGDEMSETITHAGNMKVPEHFLTQPMAVFIMALVAECEKRGSNIVEFDLPASTPDGSRHILLECRFVVTELDGKQRQS